jgi:hypothetical protein
MQDPVEVLAVLAAIWLLTTLVVLGACRAAAHGDAVERHRRSVHWGSLER